MKMNSIISSLLGFLFIVSCATTSPKAEKAAYVPKFDYTPPEEAMKDTTGISFGLVSAHYSEDQPWVSVWPFTQFSNNMELDFQELLIARGFTVKGPFHAVEEMTYPDKKGCDLVLSPNIEVTLDLQDTKYEEVINLLGPNSYRLQGTAFIGGRVTLPMIESLTGERMWLKSIDLPQTSVKWVGEKKYKTIPGSADLSDPGLTTALGPQMETFYNEVLETAWKYLHPEEMAIINKQSKELRARKVY
ncbi:MAG: hypothetical protein DWQ10_06235 [Calditrichaeota bacterium]|nr:MAG: hypothetical protein DWQ10_06235 [Calditrichota bacterium]